MLALRYKNNNVYKGPLRNGKPHGYGSLYIPTPELTAAKDQKGRFAITFYREWCDGEMLDGDGHYEDESAQYFGQFKGRKRHGLGKIVYTSKATYCGQYVDDSKHGVGEYVSEHGDVYRGYWDHGLRNGVGIESYGGRSDDTGKYIGHWKGGVRHGCGVMLWPDGQYALREYSHGTLVSERLIDATIAQRLMQKYRIAELEKALDAVLAATAEKEKKVLSLMKFWNK
jgi:hypothetical protein